MKDGLDIFDIVAELKVAAGYRGVTRVALPSEYYRMYADAVAKGMTPVQCSWHGSGLKVPLEVVDSGVGLHEPLGRHTPGVPEDAWEDVL